MISNRFSRAGFLASRDAQQLGTPRTPRRRLPRAMRGLGACWLAPMISPKTLGFANIIVTVLRVWTRRGCPSARPSAIFSPCPEHRHLEPPNSRIMVSFRPQFRARRAVGLLLAGRVCAQSSTSWPCYDSASGATCSGCYDLGSNSCYSGASHFGCVGAHLRWCGADPCSSCTGCYDTSGNCDTAVLDQATCLSVGGARHCGADEGTCVGCSSCYLKRGNGGAMCDPTLSSEGSACTHYNSVDGIDNTWCPTLNGDVCGECN